MTEFLSYWKGGKKESVTHLGKSSGKTATTEISRKHKITGVFSNAIHSSLCQLTILLKDSQFGLKKKKKAAEYTLLYAVCKRQNYNEITQEDHENKAIKPRSH